MADHRGKKTTIIFLCRMKDNKQRNGKQHKRNTSQGWIISLVLWDRKLLKTLTNNKNSDTFKSVLKSVKMKTAQNSTKKKNHIKILSDTEIVSVGIKIN